MRAPQRGALSGLPVRLPFFRRPKFRDTWGSLVILAPSPGAFAPDAPVPHAASDDGLAARTDCDVLVNHGDGLLATASDAVERQYPIVVASECTNSGGGAPGGLDGCGLRLMGWAIPTNPEVQLAQQPLGLGRELHAEPMQFRELVSLHPFERVPGLDRIRSIHRHQQAIARQGEAGMPGASRHHVLLFAHRVDDAGVAIAVGQCHFATVADCNGAIVGQHVEVESGRKSDRPELAKALEAARKGRATLLIAKLDRLARNVAFIANLMDAGVDFVAVDQPFASRLTLHILAAVAEDEARRISERTKAALQAAKVRGVKLGSPIAAETAATARAAWSAQRRQQNSTTRTVIADIRRSGVVTLIGIAQVLESRGVKTPAGRSTWQPAQVSRLLAA
jgi:DNA invertase Pin-like site-specific DNA recombinase